MKEFSFDKSTKSLRGSSLKKKSITLNCQTEKERFSVTVSRFGASDVSDDTKRPPELFELRTCSKRSLFEFLFLRIFFKRKKDSFTFNNPYDLIRAIANTIKFPSTFIKDMLITEIRDVYNVPKPTVKSSAPASTVQSTVKSPAQTSDSETGAAKNVVVS